MVSGRPENRMADIMVDEENPQDLHQLGTMADARASLYVMLLFE